MPLIRETSIENKNIDEIELVAFKYGESLFPSKYAFYNDVLNVELPIAWLFYLIRYREKNILVDTGISDLSEFEKYGFHLQNFIEPIKLIREYGLKQEEITDVIITHSHFDHIADINYYKYANIYIQADEFETYKENIESREKVITFMDYINVYDKFVVKRVGGHTKGSSIVTFNYGMREYVLAGDECYLKANIEKQIPTGIFHDIDKSKGFIEKYKDSDGMILLCHEPDVVEDGLGFKKILP